MGGFFDYAEDLNPEIMLTGIGMMLIPFTLSFIQFSGIFTSSLTPIQTTILFLYGIFTFVGGFLHGEALYLRSFMDISAAVGIILLATAIVPVINEGFWIQISVGSLVFLALPSTALAYFNRESRFEKHRKDDRDYLRRD